MIKKSDIAPIKSRNLEIELLRFIFSVGIVLCHSNAFAVKGVATLFRRGMLGVEFFFIVTGYLMAFAVMRKNESFSWKNTKAFLQKKIQAFGPDFVISFIIAFIVVFLYDGKYTLKALFILAKNVIWEFSLVFMIGISSKHVNGGDWYLSAMLIALLVLYPLACKYREKFLKVIAPAISVVAFVVLYYKFGTTAGVYNRVGWFYAGLIRGFADISLGAACLPLVQSLQKRSLTAAGRKFITAIEALLLITILAYFQWAAGRWPYKGGDVAAMLMITGLICLSFSGLSNWNNWFKPEVCLFLGNISLDVYLSNVYWAHMMKKLYMGKVEYVKLLLIYLLLVTVSTFVTYKLARLWRAHIPSKGAQQ